MFAIVHYHVFREEYSEEDFLKNKSDNERLCKILYETCTENQKKKLENIFKKIFYSIPILEQNEKKEYESKEGNNKCWKKVIKNFADIYQLN